MRVPAKSDTAAAAPHAPHAPVGNGAIDQKPQQSPSAAPTTDEAPVPPSTSNSKARAEWGPTGFDGASSAKAAAVAAPATPAVKSNAEIVDAFYDAFARKDGRAMSAAYAPGAHFSDKVFPDLDGAQAGAMWRMLTRSPELKIQHKILKVDGDTVTAQWIANYPAPGTGRPVENHVTATLQLKDGKIVDHKDDFDMNKWVHMAFGGIADVPFLSGALAGITRHLAGRQLKKFIADGG